MEKRGLLELILGHYILQVVYGFYTANVFGELVHGCDASSLANLHGYDEEALTGLLALLSRSTDLLLLERPGHYQLNSKYREFETFGFHLEKFMGAYGPAVAAIDEVLRSQVLGKPLVNASALAHAFAGLHQPPQVITDLIREWKVRSLLDLGCGSGTLLVDFCKSDSDCCAWGLDQNAEMCAEARRRVEIAGLAGRVSILQANAESAENVVSEDVRSRIDAVHASSLLNEFFRGGSVHAVALVRHFKKLFPGKLLFVVDYYGTLLQPEPISSDRCHALLQDVAQVVSGQGVPPFDLEGWATVYNAADCRILHAYHGRGEGIDWFVHVVRL